MRTTIEISDQTLQDIIKQTGATSKKKAVEIALKEFLRLKRQQELIARIGNFDDFDLSIENLERIRDE